MVLRMLRLHLLEGTCKWIGWCTASFGVYIFVDYFPDQLIGACQPTFECGAINAVFVHVYSTLASFVYKVRAAACSVLLWYPRVFTMFYSRSEWVKIPRATLIHLYEYCMSTWTCLVRALHVAFATTVVATAHSQRSWSVLAPCTVQFP